jgi:CheY-like chemotaxis protein
MAERARDIMERQLAHMVRLVDDLLDVSRVSRGKVELRRERLAVATILEHAVETSRPLIDAGRHALTVRAPAAPLWIFGDLTRLAQVFSNLLNNAAKFTAAGGAIELSAAAEADQVVIRVRDNGAGIPAEMLPRVFDMFAQVDRTLDRAQGGLGIGLALARGLVEMHGGTTEADSPGLGFGSTFTVRLPRAAEGDATDEPNRAAGPAPRRRILVVDDNVDGAESLALLLELGGHEIATAHGGREALAVAATFAPDVVLLDIGLPELDGYEVARRLRADPRTAGARLIALTGWGSDADKQRSHDAGFDAHLTKPVDAATLAEVLAAP